MAIISNKAIKISQKHLLGIQDLSINDVKIIHDKMKREMLDRIELVEL